MSQATQYIGTKIVSAKPMNRADYNIYRGWALPDDEDGSDLGYLVEYLDGGAPNDPRHAGYISWSPRAQFDAAYLCIGDVSGYEPHIQRLIGEKAQNDDRLAKLQAFFGTEIFAGLPLESQSLLKMQADTMGCLSKILQLRIPS